MTRSLLFTALLIMLCAPLVAAVPSLINYQGRLTNADGTPVSNGNYSVVFTIYDAASGGSSKWTETRSVATSSGLFAILLGSVNPISDSVFRGTSRFLGTRIGADPEMTPRTAIVTVPNAFRVGTVDGASGGNISGMVTISGVQEGLRLQGSTAGFANSTWINFRDGAGTDLGYVGDGSTTDQNMYLTSYVGDVHLYTPYGPALTASASGNVGIGTTTPSSSSRFHVLGGDFGTAIYGQTTLASATAVYGLASAPSAVGLLGSATGTNTIGVWGFSNVGHAGYFSGNVHVQGTLSKLAGSFQIDHPLDPANKYLSHSFVESPDMKNIYDGIVILDVNGEATVQLPDWFGALNKDFRYQLTCVGGYAPVYISEGVHDNKFSIAGGTPNLSVSWQVTGIRQDAYANAHRIPVEEMKSDLERGYYLAPEALGFPIERSIDWARRPELMRELRDSRLKDNKDQ